MNRDDGISAVVLTTEHFLDFAGVNRAGQRFEPFAKLRQRAFITLFGPLDQDRQIVTPAAQSCDELSVLLETASALKESLRRFLILPEIGRGDLRLYVFQLFVRFGRLKDSSADPPPV
jgi:hypothetical protein